jgi:hypothetical protein
VNQSINPNLRLQRAPPLARKAPLGDTCYHTAPTRSLQLPRAVATQWRVIEVVS